MPEAVPLDAANIIGADSDEVTSSRVVRWARSLFQPVDISFLVFFRMSFAVMVLWHIWRLWSTGSIAYYYIDPPFHFTYYGFSWVKPWPGNGMYWHFGVMAVLAVGILIGACYRLCAALFCVGFIYEFLLEKGLYQNHYYLLCLISFWMVILPAHKAVSVDALLRPKLRSWQVPAWTLWLLRIQLAITYFYGGLAKLNADWLRGQPIRMGLAERTHFPFVGHYFTEEWMVQFFVWGGLGFDLLVVPALLWRRTRMLAYVAAVVFHLINSQMWQIGIFPWFMILGTLIFFPSDWPHRILATSRRRQPLVSRATDQPLTRGQKWALAGLGTYMAIQLLVPFRHYLYPGDVNWTEEGHRFAWHMMLRGKTVAVRFYGTDPETRRTGAIPVRGLLTQRQVEKLGKEPDMLLEFAHYLSGELRKKGFGDVEIRALALMSLNGRKPQLYIDPMVNLASEPRTWRRYSWIMPLQEPLRHDAWTVPMLEWEQHVDFDTAAYVKALSRPAPERTGSTD